MTKFAELFGLSKQIVAAALLENLFRQDVVGGFSRQRVSQFWCCAAHNSSQRSQADDVQVCSTKKKERKRAIQFFFSRRGDYDAFESTRNELLRQQAKAHAAQVENENKKEGKETCFFLFVFLGSVHEPHSAVHRSISFQCKARASCSVTNQVLRKRSLYFVFSLRMKKM